MKLFSDSLPFHKGNLHTHTTLSDGRKSVEEAVEMYKANGYDFIAVTDHRKRYPGFETPDFIVLPGGEYHYQPGTTAYHIVGIGLTDDVAWSEDDKPQEIIDKVAAAGGFPILAHPSWSLMSVEDGMALHGYRAVEIYNGISEGYDGTRGYSDQFIDVCATRGRLTGIIADDDAHFYVGLDNCRGWICLQSEAFTTQGIMDSLWAGRYYSSTGPELFQIEIDDEKNIHVECGPVKKISFMTNTWFVMKRNVIAPDGGTLTSADYSPVKTDKWVRIEGVDENGRFFWSNFIEL